MARYVDGYVLPVPKRNVEAYRQLAQAAGNVWREHVFRSREDRDRINAAVMKDPRIAGKDPTSMPFDGKRMFWGGFDVLVEA